MVHYYPALRRLLGLVCGVGLAVPTTFAQVGVGTTSPDAKAALDIQGSGKGLLIPRMDSSTRAAIATPPDGLMVFQTDGRKGFWYAVAGQWVYIPDKTRSGDNLGSHTATQTVRLNNQWLSNDGGAEGLRIDNVGNVAISGQTVIGTLTGPPTQTIQPLLQANALAYGAAVPDQIQTAASTAFGGSSVWQSFRAGRTGLLTQVVIQMEAVGFGSSAGILEIYAGEGGNPDSLLLAQSASFPSSKVQQPFSLSTPVVVQAGRQYTALLKFSAMGGLLLIDGTYSNPYPDGRSSVSASADCRFETYVRPLGNNIALAALNTGQVGIGTDSPTATLEVSGAASTVKLGGLAGTGERVVTAADDGALTTVTKASLADNLGNHAATQNLNLGANLLVGNGGSSGLQISSAGNVGIGGAATTSRLEVSGSARVSGNARVGANAEISGNAEVSGNARVGGNLGIGANPAVTALDVDGGLTVRPNGYTVLAANQVITVGDRSYVRGVSNTFIAGGRVIGLTNGLAPGQVLVISNASSVANGGVDGGIFQLNEGGNVNLNGTSGRQLTPGDVLTLIWDGNQWLEQSFSGN